MKNNLIPIFASPEMSVVPVRVGLEIDLGPGGETSAMCTAAVPADSGEALGLVESLLGSLAGEDAAELPAEVVAGRLRALERVDAIGAAMRGRYLEVFDAQDGHISDGQRTARTWLVHCTRVTKGQAGEHKAVEALARDHRC
jgi:hypothetical protein